MAAKYETRPWNVADLRPADYNPRKWTADRFDDLKRSMAADPDFLHARPLIVNVNPERRGVIVGGNMRYAAAVSLGYAEVPCVEVDLTLERERVWCLRDNAHHGEWDAAALSSILAQDPPSFSTALPEDMLKGLLAVETPSFGEAGEGAVPSLDKKNEIECPACGHLFRPA